MTNQPALTPSTPSPIPVAAQNIPVAAQAPLPAAGAVPTLDDLLAERENSDFTRASSLRTESEFLMNRGQALRSLACLCKHFEKLVSEQMQVASGHAAETPALNSVRGELVNRFQGNVTRMLARHPELPDFQEQWNKTSASASRSSSGLCIEDASARQLVAGAVMSDAKSTAIRDFFLSAADVFTAATKGDFVETARGVDRCKAAAAAITLCP